MSIRGDDLVSAKVPTLADVAKAAGVSLATASKALSNRYDVAESTKRRVLAVAEELSFTPNPLARGLLSGKTQSVGIITSDLDGRFSPRIMMGAEDALGAEKSSVVLCNSRGEPALERHHVQELLRRRVDALMVVGNVPEAREPLALKVQIPTVYVYQPSTDPADTSFVCDNRASGRMAARYLLDAGCRQVAHIGGDVGAVAAEDRADGTQQELAAAGLDLVGGKPFYGRWHDSWGWQVVGDLIERGVAFDGLVCGNDQIGRGAMEQLERRGLDVPGDVAVIGFDNWSVLSRDTRRPFPSLDMNLASLGRAAAQALVGAGDSAPGVHALPGTVVDTVVSGARRESTP